jgi:hypothetical protein
MKPTLEEQLVALADADRTRNCNFALLSLLWRNYRCHCPIVLSLQERFSKLQLSLFNPIGVSSELADLIVDLIEEK